MSQNNMEEPKRYLEEPRRQFGGILSDNEYAKAMQTFILVCTDFVPIDRNNRTIYLAKRSVHSSKGIWRFGGRQRAGEMTREACTRLAKRELDIEIQPERFAYFLTTEDVWAWRKQEPQNAGGHNLIHIFSVECTHEELMHAATHLDKDEYDAPFGIQSFNRGQLIAANVRPQLVDMYDTLFPQLE